MRPFAARRNPDDIIAWRSRFMWRARLTLSLLLVVWNSSPSSLAQESGKKLALLVGIDKYPSGSGFSSLPFPQRDVDALAKLLLESGYRPEHVRVMTAERGLKDDLRFLPSRRN